MGCFDRVFVLGYGIIERESLKERTWELCRFGDEEVGIYWIDPGFFLFFEGGGGGGTL